MRKLKQQFMMFTVAMTCAVQMSAQEAVAFKLSNPGHVLTVENNDERDIEMFAFDVVDAAGVFQENHIIINSSASKPVVRAHSVQSTGLFIRFDANDKNLFVVRPIVAFHGEGNLLVERRDKALSTGQTFDLREAVRALRGLPGVPMDGSNPDFPGNPQRGHAEPDVNPWDVCTVSGEMAAGEAGLANVPPILDVHGNWIDDAGGTSNGTPETFDSYIGLNEKCTNGFYTGTLYAGLFINTNCPAGQQYINVDSYLSYVASTSWIFELISYGTLIPMPGGTNPYMDWYLGASGPSIGTGMGGPCH